jgi:hypothetical protein
MHWQRTFLHPMLANFDAPSRDECAAQRVVSNTPQQALTLLNDPTFVEAARLFAARLLGDRAATGDDQRIRRAFSTRPGPRPETRRDRFAAKIPRRATRHYRAAPADAEKLLKIGLAPTPPAKNAPDPVELAAWTKVARVLLNAQETITRY